MHQMWIPVHAERVENHTLKVFVMKSLFFLAFYVSNPFFNNSSRKRHTLFWVDC